jgi:hypothetical protein
MGTSWAKFNGAYYPVEIDQEHGVPYVQIESIDPTTGQPMTDADGKTLFRRIYMDQSPTGTSTSTADHTQGLFAGNERDAMGRIVGNAFADPTQQTGLHTGGSDLVDGPEPRGWDIPTEMYDMPDLDIEWNGAETINPWTGMAELAGQDFGANGLAPWQEQLYANNFRSRGKDMARQLSALGPNPTAEDFFNFANDGNNQVGDMSVEEHAAQLQKMHEHMKKVGALQPQQPSGAFGGGEGDYYQQLLALLQQGYGG